MCGLLSTDINQFDTPPGGTNFIQKSIPRTFGGYDWQDELFGQIWIDRRSRLIESSSRALWRHTNLVGATTMCSTAIELVSPVYLMRLCEDTTHCTRTGPGPFLCSFLPHTFRALSKPLNSARCPTKVISIINSTLSSLSNLVRPGRTYLRLLVSTGLKMSSVCYVRGCR